MKVRELLNETNWIQYYFAKNANGEKVHSCSEYACKWCLTGAIIKCYENSNEIADFIREKLNKGIIRWNDAPERTWNDVKKLIEELDI